MHKTTGIQKFDQVLRNLDNHLNICGKATSTRSCYNRALYRFISVTNNLPEESNKNEIISYFIEYKNAHALQYASLKNSIFGIKYYLKHVADRHDLIAKIPNPKIKYYDIEVLNLDEIKNLLESCKTVREKLIIQLLYETGIRVSELVNLKENDFDFYTNSITIKNSKNRTTRTVHFGNSFKETFIEYIESTKNLFSDSLFTRQFHSYVPLSKRGVSWALKTVVKRSKIKRRVTIHSLRHAFAVHYLNFGGTIYQLQKLLGHSHLITTLSYLQYAVLPKSDNISILDKLNAQNSIYRIDYKRA